MSDLPNYTHVSANRICMIKKQLVDLGKSDTHSRDCSYCGGEVVEKTIDYDYRREKRLMVISSVPAGVCVQCGEKYFKPEVLKQMDSVYHGIFERNEKPQRTLTVPAVSL